MAWLDRLLQYSRENLWEIEPENIFNGADSVEEVDKTLYSYGSFKVHLMTGYALEKLDEQIEIDPRVRLNHGGHKDFMIDYVSNPYSGGSMKSS